MRDPHGDGRVGCGGGGEGVGVVDEGGGGGTARGVGRGGGAVGRPASFTAPAALAEAAEAVWAAVAAAQASEAAAARPSEWSTWVEAAQRRSGLPGSPQPPRERSCRLPGASTRVLEHPGRTPEPRVLQVTQRRKVRAERLCDPIRLAVLPRSAVEHGDQQLVSNRDGGPEGLDVINAASRSNTSGSTHGRPSDEHLSLGQDTRPCDRGFSLSHREALPPSPLLRPVLPSLR